MSTGTTTSVSSKGSSPPSPVAHRASAWRAQRRLAERAARGARLDVASPGEHPTRPYALVLRRDRRSFRPGSDRDVVGRFGALDIVVANAGIGAQGTVEESSDDDWHRVFDVNVVGVARIVRAALPHLRIVAWGCRRHVLDRLVGWATATRGVHGQQGRALRTHAGDGRRPHRRRCPGQWGGAPGTADTPWIARLLEASTDPDAERAALEARQPMGRLVSADEVAHAIAYLASPRSASTTGTVLAVDGGMLGLRLPFATAAGGTSANVRTRATSSAMQHREHLPSST